MGWGCRCEVIQLPGKNHKETPDGSFQKPDVPPQFRENFGKKQQLFSDKHPYYQNKCQGCTKAAKLATENNLQCQACLKAGKECKEFMKEGRVVFKNTKEAILNLNNKNSCLSGAAQMYIVNSKDYKPLSDDMPNIMVSNGFDSDTNKNELLKTAIKAVKHRNKVWILGNPNEGDSPDYIFKKANILKVYDQKTINGRDSIFSTINNP